MGGGRGCPRHFFDLIPDYEDLIPVAALSAWTEGAALTVPPDTSTLPVPHRLEKEPDPVFHYMVSFDIIEQANGKHTILKHIEVLDQTTLRQGRSLVLYEWGNH